MLPAAAAELRGAAAHGRYRNLDFVRFVAAALVLVSHSYTLAGRGGEPAFFGYETLGGLAVAVFFVISGFLVAGAWERNPRIGTFACHRALRILPALIVVVALGALVLGPLLTTLPLADYLGHPHTRKYFANVTFTRLNYSLPGVFAHNPYPHAVNGSLWTLPIEVAMYGVLGLLAALGLVRRTFASMLVGALALVWFGAGPAWLAAWTDRWPAVLPPVAVVQLALWFFTGTLFWVWRVRTYGVLALALVTAAWLVQGTLVGRVLLHVAVPYAVLWFAQAELGAIGRFGRHGDFSYGMYLYAFPVQQTFAHFGAASWPFGAYVVACFAVTLACAVASWRVVEAPALRLKHRRSALAARAATAREAPPARA